MSKRELVQKVFENKPAERVPVGFWFHFTKTPVLDGFKHPEMFEQNTAGHRQFYADFQPDFIKIMTDGYFVYPSEDFLGAQSIAGLRKVKSIGAHHPWIEKQVEHAQTLTGIFGAELMTFYNIFAPMTIFKFCHMNQQQNVDALLADLLLEDADAVNTAMRIVAEDIALLVKRVLTEGKVDGIYYSVQDPADTRITPELRAKALTPHDYTILNTASSVSQYNILHICGYEGRRNKLANYIDYPAQIFNWASVVEQLPLSEGKKLFKGKPIIGGFDNTVNGVLFRGSKTEIEAETARLLGDAGTTGVALGADCSLPDGINLDNLRYVRDKAASLSTR